MTENSEPRSAPTQGLPSSPAPRFPRVAWPRASRVLLLTLLAAALLALPAGASRKRAEEEAAVAALSPEHRAWLEEVELLISPQEKAIFLALAKDYQREAFIERFWQMRDPYPDTPRNEARDNWRERIELARQSWGNLKEDRARILLLNGPPAIAFKATCATVLWPLEIWAYPRSERLPDSLAIIFVQRFGAGPYRIWQPADGVSALTQSGGFGASNNSAINEIIAGCMNGDQIAGALSAVLRHGVMGYPMILARAEGPIEPPSREWAATFNSYSTDLPEGAAEFEAELALSFPGRRQARTVVQGTLSVPRVEATRADLAGHHSYNFQLNGEVLRAGKLFDSFRYRFDLPAVELESEALPLVFERYLRPGDYTLILKLEDLNSQRFWRDERTLDVPALEPGAAPVLAPETARLLEEANAAVSVAEVTLKLIVPRSEMQAGLVRFDALTTGEGIDEVVFTLDGRPVLTKNRPPFSVELDLGNLPRPHTLRAEARNPAGEMLVADEVIVNASAHRFAVRLTEPRRGQRYSQSLRAEAQVQVPEEGAVERVEFFLNETLVATLFQPPWAQPILLPSDQEIAYVRAVAYQPDGNSTEDLVFVNAPDYLEEVEVQLVELFTAVLDRKQRPVLGLERQDFSVSEDGVPQELMRFERVENLPIHAAVLLDVSASMEPSLGEAQKAALQFFEHAVTPRDRAALITFNDHPNLAVKLTNQVPTLGGGLAGLKAERGTALYDALVFGLYYFNGVKGQRAILLLTDGKDEGSRFPYEDALDFAQRAGVVIYTIGLDIPRREFDTRKKLARFAEETGGQSFFVKTAADLPAIYEAIQKELRSRYLLAYQSTSSATDGKFREIEVRLSKGGLEAKTLRGYYP